jgi:glycosyltransferase involved in cell wall biosynthesis
MRVCLVYDHLFPHTVGGAERWMRDLALHLASSGHDVTYLTMRHWPQGSDPDLPGVRVLGLTDPGRVYTEGRRALRPPLRFGLAVGRHLLAHGSSYDVVHLASFPYFPLLAAGALRRFRRYNLVVDWHEVWTRTYWRRYAGAGAGTLGWLVQKACVRLDQTANCMSTLHARRLLAEGYRGVPTLLSGLYAGTVEPTPSDLVDSGLVVYAGRHVPEKRVGALVRAFALARERRLDLRLELYGDGPERPRIEMLVHELGLGPAVRVLGRRPEVEVAHALSRAACVATASEREGYGLVVVEAAAHGTPSVVAAGPENAAVELVQDGINGVVSPSASPSDLAEGLLRVVDGGVTLRASTAHWFAENASKLRIEASIDQVLAGYRQSGVE